jgi:hypothetical protein
MDRVISARADALGISFDQMKGEYLEKISLRRKAETPVNDRAENSH